MSYEDALNLKSNMSNSKSQKYLFEQNNPAKANRFRRKNSQNLGKVEKSIFDRLFDERLEKKFKMEALKEHHSMHRDSFNKPKHRKSKSANKDRSMSQKEFYNKQMKLKAESNMKLAIMMLEQAKLIQERIKPKTKSRSRKRSQSSKQDNQESNVHQRLYNDMRERSKRRICADGKLILFDISILPL